MARNWNPFTKSFWNGDESERVKPMEERTIAQFSANEVRAMCARTHVGAFELTGAIQPHPRFAPTEGYRTEFYHDDAKGIDIPMLVACTSRGNLWDVFYELTSTVGSEVDVILDTCHHFREGPHTRQRKSLYREEIDTPVLQSTLIDHQESLLQDGCAGLAVVNAATRDEVQLDEHKLLIIYAKRLQPYAAILDAHGIPLKEKTRFTVSDDDHMHISSPELQERFEALVEMVGFSRDEDDEDQYQTT